MVAGDWWGPLVFEEGVFLICNRSILQPLAARSSVCLLVYLQIINSLCILLFCYTKTPIIFSIALCLFHNVCVCVCKDRGKFCVKMCCRTRHGPVRVGKLSFPWLRGSEGCQSQVQMLTAYMEHPPHHACSLNTTLLGDCSYHD